MDSQVILDWYRANLIDNRWRQDVLPPGEVITILFQCLHSLLYRFKIRFPKYKGLIFQT